MLFFFMKSCFYIRELYLTLSPKLRVRIFYYLGTHYTKSTYKIKI